MLDQNTPPPISSQKPGFFEKLTNWELWPAAAVYLPLAPFWVWYCLRARSIWWFTPSNPTIPFGGYEGETKTDVYKQLPDGVYLTTMKQENQVVLLTGIAQSNERVSELLRNLSNNSPWLTRPELIEITGRALALSARDQRRVSNFSMRVALKRATDVQKTGATASPAAGKPAPAASAAVKG